MGGVLNVLNLAAAAAAVVLIVGLLTKRRWAVRLIDRYQRRRDRRGYARAMRFPSRWWRLPRVVRAALWFPVYFPWTVALCRELAHNRRFDATVTAIALVVVCDLAFRRRKGIRLRTVPRLRRLAKEPWRC